MGSYTNEAPENLEEFIKHLKFYTDKSYLKGDKESIKLILANSTVDIVKTGQWGSIYGHAAAKATYFIDSNKLELVNTSIRENIREMTYKILQSLNCGLEVIEVDFVPKYNNQQQSVEDELTEIVTSTKVSTKGIELPADLIKKGIEMSEAYLYIYFVENTLRLFVEKVAAKVHIVIPQEVAKTILKNKALEQQNKFIPLRGADNLYYCDFVQLQQIIVNNWEVFKDYFPQRDQHWLRVKIEDMYRVRNIIAHCGYIGKEEFEMIKSNFNMILKQIKI